jgi:hypothetical protein
LQVLPTHRFVQHRARAIVALSLLAVLALALAACGGDSGGSGGSGSNAETLLRQTFTGTHEIRSGRADVELRIVATGDPSIDGPIELGISGPFQSAGAERIPRFDLAFDVRAQGQSFDAGLTSTSDRLFVRFGGTSYEVPAQLLDELEESWRSQDEGSGQEMSLEGLGLDPMSWLEDPTVEGTETVGGTETEHISADLDVSALLDDVDTLLAEIDERGLSGAGGPQVPSRLPADTRRQIEDAVRSGTVDVWTGSEDHTLRRLSVALEIEPPEDAGDGPSSLDLSLTIELSDLNEPQTIEAPATTRPLDELLGQFQGLLGGALGGADGLDGGSGGGASSDQLDAYTRCIQEAGSDVERAQECAALLTE